MSRSYVLVGMMGCGKSTVGMRLAERLDLPFLDTDSMLERKLGRPSAQLFDLFGEVTFRDHESRILAELSDEPRVLATGGGIVLRPENWEHLRRLGTIVWLNIDRGVIKDRLATTKRRRPLLDRQDWPDHFDSILDERKDLYAQADVQITGAFEKFEDVVDVIIAKAESA